MPREGGLFLRTAARKKRVSRKRPTRSKETRKRSDLFVRRAATTRPLRFHPCGAPFPCPVSYRKCESFATTRMKIFLVFFDESTTRTRIFCKNPLFCKSTPYLLPLLAQPRKPQLQFAVHIQHPRSLHAESGDLAIGQRGEVLLFAGDALDVDSNDPLVGEHHPVPHGFVGADDVFPGYQQGLDQRNQAVVLLHFDETCILKINHGWYSLFY